MPNDLVAWIEQAPRHVLFLTLESNHDWQRLTDLQDTVPRAVIVAVLTDGSVPTYVRAISAGAVTAMPRDARPEEVRRIFEQVLHGESILPIEVVRALTTSAGEKREQEEALRPHEVSWLRQLAGGATVAQLAHRTGYSERAMFRLLRQLYVRMNVKNRTEALLRAQERGWL